MQGLEALANPVVLFRNVWQIAFCGFAISGGLLLTLWFRSASSLLKMITDGLCEINPLPFRYFDFSDEKTGLKFGHVIYFLHFTMTNVKNSEDIF